jgi:sarcosine oxidase, subunit alpha
VSGRRLAEGGSAIDRSRPVQFTFDGVAYAGFVGDTLASALLANGVEVVCRSPILGRPRGVYSAGVEEPCAFVEVQEPWFDPIVAATMVNLVDGLVAFGRPGIGRLATGDAASTKRSRRRHAHVESLVIVGDERFAGHTSGSGGGERTWLLLDGARGSQPVEIDAAVRVLERTTALGLYDDGYVVALQREPDLDTMWHLRADRVTLITGAHERSIGFSDNDRPGIMLAESARTYLQHFGVLPGQRIVVFTTHHEVYDVADVLRHAGAEIVAIVDVAQGGEAAERARGRGIEVLSGWAVAGTDGDPAVDAVHVVGPDGERRTLEADLLAVSGGWNPAVQLYRAIGGGLRYDEGLAAFVPDGSGPEWLRVVGRAAGTGLPSCVPYWSTPADDRSRQFVDMQRDQTVADVLDAVERGLRSVEHVKRATYIGTAIDQGRTSNVLTAEIVNTALGWELGAQGPTSARPPAVPVSFATLAGPDRGMLLDPVRTTPIHDAHAASGAVFENVGQWKRPRYYPHDGEEMDHAVARECSAVRSACGVLDASTLGKIEVVGPDAGAFLDRMYTNRMSNVAVGSIRYGLMLGLDGMVLDDGVAMRLGEDRYLVTTTTGGAAAVLDRFEEWLQTEWPDLRVYCTSVTEQWAVVAVGGPGARDVVAALGTDIDLSAEAFPWMTWREGSVAGVPARVCRVSFHGELCYELHVAAWHGSHVWDWVAQAGATPYGTEAMHVLRAEKGYVIVGQDTDGTVTPDDLGMGWIVNPSKGDFVGKRSLVRPDTVRPDRARWVGLLPDDPDLLLPEGTQVVAAAELPGPPVPMLGHVTSSYRSPTLGRTFALAMVKDGRSLGGHTVYAALRDGTHPVAVTPTVFYDPEDAYRDG